MFDYSLKPLNLGRLMRLFLVYCLVAICAPQAFAQTVVEENQPRERVGEQLVKLPGLDRLAPVDVSDAPFGVALRGIVILGDPQDVALSRASKGVDLSGIELPAGIDPSSILEPFLGQQISLRLLVTLRDAIVRSYIDAGRAFVAGTIPPQEISNGVVQIIISESVLEEKKITGLRFSDVSHIRTNIRAQVGEVVDTDQLIDDLNWLNLNPYRNLVVVAEPGKEFGRTVLNFSAQESKPWSAFFGANNNGGDATGTYRLSLGGQLANLPLIDHQLNYQFTMSPEAQVRLSQPLTATAQAAYRSHDGNYFVPLAWRHKLRLRAALIETRSNLTGGLVSASDTRIQSLEYAVPLARTATLSPEIYGLFEAKRNARDIYGAGTLISAAQLDVNQVTLGLRGNRTGRRSRTNFDLKVTGNPGGLSRFDTATAHASFSGNPNADPRYAYVFANVQNALSVANGVTFVSSGTVQYANASLPSTEVLGIGGPSTVRGHSVSEASGDRGYFLRNELHFDIKPKMSLAEARALDLAGFLDIGFVEDLFRNRKQSLSGAGLSLSAQFDQNIAFDASVGVALNDGETSRRGDVQINFNLNVGF